MFIPEISDNGVNDALGDSVALREYMWDEKGDTTSANAFLSIIQDQRRGYI